MFLSFEGDGKLFLNMVVEGDGSLDVEVVEKVVVWFCKKFGFLIIGFDIVVSFYLILLIFGSFEYF